MPFLDTNTQMTTKPYNFDIKCQCNFESYDRHGFFGTKFRGQHGSNPLRGRDGGSPLVGLHLPSRCHKVQAPGGLIRGHTEVQRTYALHEGD